MGWKDFFINRQKEVVAEQEVVASPKSNHDYGYSENVTYGMHWPVITKKWDGEKTPGELGVVIKNIPDYHRLRLRAYDAEMKIDLINIITGRYFKWVVGSGLKLQAEPNKTILEMENIKIAEDFSKKIEARFSNWANSKYADFSKETNLHGKALDCFSSSFLGGDSLVICRVDDFDLNVQIIDGQHIKTPDQKNLDAIKERGNFEEMGIEYNSKGEHVAYFVTKKSLEKKEYDLDEFVRIPVYGETKRKLAWIVYGSKHRIDHKRGITRLSSIIEKVNKLDRYTEATVSKAEQGANILFTIKHNSESTGENMLDSIRKQKLRITVDENNSDPHSLADGLANRITQTTSNQTFNLPIGAELVPYQSNSENNFDMFYKAVFNGLCASIGIPPEVAMQMYNSNYSASRAAINGWGYIVDIDRKKLADDFYKPIYSLFLEIQILKNKIQAPKFLESISTNDYQVTEAYKNCRFIGKNMPHIDPVKEVKAVVEMLNNELITREQATETLNAGDWNENFEKKLQEDKKIPKPKIENNGNTKNTNGQ